MAPYSEGAEVPVQRVWWDASKGALFAPARRDGSHPAYIRMGKGCLSHLGSC